MDTTRQALRKLAHALQQAAGALAELADAEPQGRELPVAPPQPPPPERHWLSTTQAAERAGVSVTSVSNALRSGDLRGYQARPGCNWTVSAADVDRWVRREPTAPA